MDNVQALTLVDMFQYQGNSLRHILIDSEPWWVASDTCKILDLEDVSKAVERLDNDEKLIRIMFVSGQNRNVLFVNESGVYHLIFTSRKSEAQTFRKWVTNEVLPAIRKTGNYSLQGDYGIAELLALSSDEFNEKLHRIRRLYRAIHTLPKPPKLPKPHLPKEPRPRKEPRTFEEEVMYVLKGLPPNTFYSARLISHQTTLLRLVGTPKVRVFLNEQTEQGAIAKNGTGKQAVYELVK